MTTKNLLSLIRREKVAVEASTSQGGAPQAAVVGFAITDQFEIVFDTLGTSRKAINLRADPRIALVIGGMSRGDEWTVQYEGVADEPTGKDLERLKQAYYAVHPDGPSRLMWPGLIYVRLKPLWIRYSDFSRETPEIIEMDAGDLMDGQPERASAAR